MTVYAKINTDGIIEIITTQYTVGYSAVNVTSLADIEYIPGHDKTIDQNNFIIDIVSDVKLQYITSLNIKRLKVGNVSKLQVTTSTGKIFDGDETSQDRMVRAIQIASITGLTETQWKLANNEIVMVSLDELKEALALAGQEMSRIWLEQ